MKLAYLWVENYKCFKELEIKFRNIKKNSNSVVLDEPSHLFQNIDSVYCFIGKNGVGKSTLIEILLKAFSGDLLETEFQLIFTSNDNIYSLSNGKEKIVAENILKVSKLDKRITKNCSVAFYSPIYNPHNTFKVRRNASVINVSSDILYKSSRSISRLKDTRLQFNFLSRMDSFASGCLSFDKYFQVENSIPNFGTIKRLLRKEFERLKSSKSKNNAEVLNEYLDELVDIGIDRGILSDYKSKNTRFEEISLFIEMDHVFENIQIAYNEYKADRGLEEQIKLDFILMEFIKFIKFERNELETLKQETLRLFLRIGKRGNFDQWIRRIEETPIAYEDELRALTRFSRILTKSGYKRMPIPIEVSQYEEFFKITDLITKMKVDGNFIKYSWRGISSGQLAKLNLYSRIYHSVLQSDGNSCLVILDEADVFLHPEWQINFFSDLEKYFKEIKKEFPEIVIDLLVTTHSPLVLTDMFKESVFEIKNRNGKSTVKNSKDPTFAANVYDLYENEFKVSSAKGRFASYKIDKLIETIRTHKMLNDTDHALLDNIGEPILKRSLISLMEKNGYYR